MRKEGDEGELVYDEAMAMVKGAGKKGGSVDTKKALAWGSERHERGYSTQGSEFHLRLLGGFR